MNICWITLHVQDLERSLNFYTDLFGLELVRRFRPDGQREIAFLGSEGTQLELIQDPQVSGAPRSEDISIGFPVSSLQSIMKKLEDLDIPVHSGPFEPNPMISFIYVLDPDGFKIQLVQQS